VASHVSPKVTSDYEDISFAVSCWGEFRRFGGAGGDLATERLHCFSLVFSTDGPIYKPIGYERIPTRAQQYDVERQELVEYEGKKGSRHRYYTYLFTGCYSRLRSSTIFYSFYQNCFFRAGFGISLMDEHDMDPEPYQEQGLPTMEALMRSLAEGQRHNQGSIDGLTQAVVQLLHLQQPSPRPPTTSAGPKVKEPRAYDGDRSNGKLDDHIRDVTNWVNFYEVRNHWTSPREAVEQASNYLTGKMHRIYSLQNAALQTMPQYVAWLKVTFKDHNEQQRYRQEWQATVQGSKTVHEYASDLVYLAAQIEPRKTDDEIKEHFRTGLNERLQLKIAENPEWDDLDLDALIGRADRQEQIEASTSRFRNASEYRSESRGRAYAIAGAPRRGGRRPSSLTRKPRKGTQEWQDWCRSRNACYGCGEPGHSARDCSQAGPSDGKTSRGRTDSPYPRMRSPSRSPSRERSMSRSSSTGRRPSQKGVSFSSGKAQA
jgi:Retrotransposon gag protein/Zinc knuckle